MSRTPDTNIKAVLLSTADNIINEFTVKLNKFYSQDEPYTVEEEEQILKLQDNLFKFLKFRKAFASEVNYDFKVLQQVVEKIVALQR